MLPAERLFRPRILGHDQINVEELRRHDTALDKPVFVNGLSALRASKTDWLRSGDVSYGTISTVLSAEFGNRAGGTN